MQMQYAACMREAGAYTPQARTTRQLCLWVFFGLMYRQYSRQPTAAAARPGGSGDKSFATIVEIILGLGIMRARDDGHNEWHDRQMVFAGRVEMAADASARFTVQGNRILFVCACACVCVVCVCEESTATKEIMWARNQRMSEREKRTEFEGPGHVPMPPVQVFCHHT